LTKSDLESLLPGNEDKIVFKKILDKARCWESDYPLNFMDYSMVIKLTRDEIIQLTNLVDLIGARKKVLRIASPGVSGK